MRPVVRGSRPQNAAGQDIEFKEYAEARGELIKRLGEFCSYCEMHLDTSLAVEHIQPKQPPGAAAVDPARALNWDNLLLACTNCNSTKGNTDVVLDDYFWPHCDNTFRALIYSAGGVVSASPDGGLKDRAEKTIKLTGLDKQPLNDPKASDRRWENRREAWDIAVRSKNNLVNCPGPEMRDQIVMTAIATGYWSIWMTVFEDDSDILQRLVGALAFPGTSTACFDPAAGYAAVPRAGGAC